MPTRNYQPVTPSGDPTNILSLVSPDISLPQVNFTAQVAVAEPENQFETLQRILVAGAGAATAALKYNENKIRNELAISAAIERQQEKEEREEYKKERKDNRDKALEKERQDAVLNSYDARITSALLSDNYEEAERLGNEFVGLYPTDVNPYMSTKALDQQVRIKNAKRAYDNMQDREEDITSAGARGFALSEVLGKIESLEAEFANPETRKKVMGLFTGEEQTLPQDMVTFFMGGANPAKIELLTEKDRIDLTTAILSRTSTLRTNIINERNNARRYARIEKRGMAAGEIALTLLDTPQETIGKLDNLFAFFSDLEDDKQSGFITQTQQNNLEKGLVASIAANAGRKTPVTGALSVADLIQDGIDDGSIPQIRGNQVKDALLRRAEQELIGEINKIVMEAASNESYTDQTSLYESSPQTNPAIDMMKRYGIIEVMEDGTTRTRAGYEKLAARLETFSQEWQRQEASYLKTGGIVGNVATIDHNFMIDDTVKGIDNALSQDVTLTPSDRTLAMTNVAIQQFNGFLAYAGDPVNREKYVVALKRVADKETAQLVTEAGTDVVTITVEGGTKFTVPTEVAQDPVFRDMVAMVAEPDKLATKLMDYYSKEVQPQSADMTGSANRSVWLYGTKLLLDRVMTGSQKSIADNPSAARSYSRLELADVAQTKAIDLKKKYKRLDNIQRAVAENETMQLVAASESVPPDWIGYLDESYFFAGASTAQLEQGYDLIRGSRGVVIDMNGNAVNFASVGTVQSEIYMSENNPIMYDTLVLADGLAVGTNKDPREFLPEAHRIATQRAAELQAAKGVAAKSALELVPQPEINYLTGKPMRDSTTMTGMRQETLRDAFNKTFNYDIPRVPFEYAGISNDPYFTMDIEDYNRMNTVFQGFRAKGYGDDAAVRASVAMMQRMGYKVIKNEGTEGPRIGLVFDPYNVIPPQEVKDSRDFKEWLGTKVSQSLGRDVSLLPNSGNTIIYPTTGDLTRPDSTVPFVILFRNGERAEFITNGINRNEFEQWKAKQTELLRARGEAGQ